MPTFDGRLYDDLKPTGHYFRFGCVFAVFVARGLCHRHLAPLPFGDSQNIGIFDDRVYYNVVDPVVEDSGAAAGAATTSTKLGVEYTQIYSLWCVNGNVLLVVVLGMALQLVEDGLAQWYVARFRTRQTLKTMGNALYQKYTQFGIEARQNRFHPQRIFYYTNDGVSFENPGLYPHLRLRDQAEIRGGFEKREKFTGDTLDGTVMKKKFADQTVSTKTFTNLDPLAMEAERKRGGWKNAGK